MSSLWVLAKVSIVVGGALLTMIATRRSSAAVRALILTAAFVAVLVLPLAGALAPALAIAIPTGRAAVADTAPAGRGPRGSLEVLVTDPAAAAGRSGATGSWRRVSRLEAVWILGALTALAPLGLSLVRASQLRRRSRRWTEAPPAVEQLLREARLARRVRICLSDEVQVPMACGVLRPIVLLPSAAAGWPARHLTHALVHELEHVRRGDLVVMPLARAAAAIHWFNPLVWLAWRRLRLEVERACDDAVVVRGAHVEYAEQLVDLARQVSSRRAQPIVAMATRTDLTERVASVLDESRPRNRVNAWASRVALAFAALLTVSIAPLQLAQAQAPKDEPRPAPFTSGPHGNFAGVVYDPTGAPLGGLLLVVEQNSFVGCADAQTRCDYGTWTRTDRFGRFRFAGLPVGGFHVTSPIDFFPGTPFDIDDGQTLERDITMTIQPVEAEFTVCADCAALVVPDSLAKEFEADRADAIDHPVSAPRPTEGWEYYKPGKGDYPAALREAGTEGSVVVEGQIGLDGVPTAMKAEPAGTPLARAAVAALAEEIWEPGRVRGVAIEVPFRFLIRYTLK